jgi:hypothetical protein
MVILLGRFVLAECRINQKSYMEFRLDHQTSVSKMSVMIVLRIVFMEIL